jgi:hypothetical protein
MPRSLHEMVVVSDVPARLGLKAGALAWLSMARAFRITRPGQSRQWRLALAWLWLKPRPMYGKWGILYIIVPLYTWNDTHSPYCYLKPTGLTKKRSRSCKSTNRTTRRVQTFQYPIPCHTHLHLKTEPPSLPLQLHHPPRSHLLPPQFHIRHTHLQ